MFVKKDKKQTSKKHVLRLRGKIREKNDNDGQKNTGLSNYAVYML
jgi:hypothetical protein